MNSLSDNQLMRRLSRGETDAIKTLFERYHVQLYNYFLRTSGRKNLSEDLVQDVFFRLLKYAHTFRGDGKFFNWLFQIARNVLVDYYKSAGRNQTVEIEQAYELTDGDNPGDLAEQQQEVRLLQAALQKLAPEKREVLVLSRFQNMKYEQVAALMNCQVGTIKARVFRAIKELREIYFELSGEDVS